MAMNYQTYEGQARISVILGAVAGAAALAGIVLILSRFDPQTGWVIYRSGSLRMPAILGTLLLSLLAGAIGFFVGYNSAGQRRNMASTLSWTGFFLNALAITLALMALVFFIGTKREITLTP